VHTERSIQDGGNEPALDVDGVPIGLKARIDRIDVHERTSRVAIIDYKTGAASDADKAHRTRERWKSLQLPLYRHVACALLGGGKDPDAFDLCFAALPSAASESSFSTAGWDPDTLHDADNRAREIVREIRALQTGDPLDPGDHPPTDGMLGFLSGERFKRGGHEDDPGDAA